MARVSILRVVLMAMVAAAFCTSQVRANYADWNPETLNEANDWTYNVNGNVDPTATNTVAPAAAGNGNGNPAIPTVMHSPIYNFNRGVVVATQSCSTNDWTRIQDTTAAALESVPLNRKKQRRTLSLRTSESKRRQLGLRCSNCGGRPLCLAQIGIGCTRISNRRDLQGTAATASPCLAKMAAVDAALVAVRCRVAASCQRLLDAPRDIVCAAFNLDCHILSFDIVKGVVTSTSSNNFGTGGSLGSLTSGFGAGSSMTSSFSSTSTSSRATGNTTTTSASRTSIASSVSNRGGLVSSVSVTSGTPTVITTLVMPSGSTFCRSVGAVNIEAHTNFDLGHVVLELTGGPTGSTSVTNTAVMGPFYVANGAGLTLEVGSYTIKAWATTLNSATSGTKHATFTVLDC
jgi:hypothetical protein